MTRPLDAPVTMRAIQAPNATPATDGQEGDAGRVIVNPISGERIVIRQSGVETNGELLAFDLFLPPGGHVPARHTHPVQEERFTIVAGLMRIQTRGATTMAHPGQTVVVPPGTPHWFGNAGNQVTHARVEVRPALRMEALFETTAALGARGGLDGGWLSRLASLARVCLDFQREIAAPYVPAFFTRAVLAPLAWLGPRQIASRASRSVK